MWIKKICVNSIKNLNIIISSVLLGLIIINSIRVIPTEIKKAELKQSILISANDEFHPNPKSIKYPDIYFILLDEAAGFDVVRDYFKYNKIDEFISFLDSAGFFVAGKSHSPSTSTLHSMAERLNFEKYPQNLENTDFFKKITENQVMSFLKEKGYKTIVFSELKQYAFSGMPPIKSDFEFYPEHDSTPISIFAKNEFINLILSNTIFSPFIEKKDFQNSILNSHEKMIYYILEKMRSIDSIESPKFVYIHVLLPHAPFLFNKSGNLNAVKDMYNYEYYLDNYIFSTIFATNIINGIIERSTILNSSPIIILQSDHGARNISTNISDNLLIDYPDEYKTHIINAIRIPDCTDAPLSQDMDPINTFPIIFKCVFGDSIPLQ